MDAAGRPHRPPGQKPVHTWRGNRTSDQIHQQNLQNQTRRWRSKYKSLTGRTELLLSLRSRTNEVFILRRPQTGPLMSRTSVSWCPHRGSGPTEPRVLELRATSWRPRSAAGGSAGTRGVSCGSVWACPGSSSSRLGPSPAGTRPGRDVNPVKNYSSSGLVLSFRTKTRIGWRRVRVTTRSPQLFYNDSFTTIRLQWLVYNDSFDSVCFLSSEVGSGTETVVTTQRTDRRRSGGKYEADEQKRLKTTLTL